MKEIVKKIESYNAKMRHDTSSVFGEFLDTFIDIFDAQHIIDGNFAQHIAELNETKRELVEAVTLTMERVSEEMESGRTFDALGRIYEAMFQTKGKASALGQFFTPECLCELMSKISFSDDMGTVYDCACGSGRTLIAARMREIENGVIYPSYYVGEDIDLSLIHI